MRTVDKTIGKLNDVFTISKEGNTRERLADGSLLCRDVPFARTGTMLYDQSEFAGELDTNGAPITSSDGVIIVHRDNGTLFSEPTITSFESAPVTVGHPPDFLNPDNRAAYDQGTIRNIRRGDGTLSDYLLADVIVKGREGLDAIEKKGIREVSPGYDADYEPIEGMPGHYKQSTITGNHLAIVERGRGGRGVRIGDEQKEPDVAFRKKTWGVRLLNAITTNDADGIEEAIREGADEMPERVEPTIANTGDEQVATVEQDDQKRHTEVLDAIHDLGNKVTALVDVLTPKTTDDEQTEQGRTDEAVGAARADQRKDDLKAVEETEDEAECLTEEGKRVPTGDAAFSAVRLNAIQVAEIIAPGMRHGTVDTSASRKEQRSAVKNIRVAALESALRGPHASVVRRYVGAQPVRNMTADAVFVAFRAAGDAIANTNRSSVMPQSAYIPSHSHTHSNPAAEMNARNRAFWGRNK